MREKDAPAVVTASAPSSRGSTDVDSTLMFASHKVDVELTQQGMATNNVQHSLPSPSGHPLPASAPPLACAAMPIKILPAAVQNLVIVQRIKALAEKKGCLPGQLALAWVHAQGEDVFPIPGALLRAMLFVTKGHKLCALCVRQSACGPGHVQYPPASGCAVAE